MIKKPFTIKAVLFDFDGTLTQPNALDFSIIKKAVGCPPEIPVLEFIQGQADVYKRGRAMAILNRFEMKAASRSLLNPGAEDVIGFLKKIPLPLGIITRNSLVSIKHTFKNFKSVTAEDFDLIVSRDTPVAPKPAPDGIILASQKLNVDVSNLAIVGDFVFDIQAGKRAGAITILLTNGAVSPYDDIKSDFTIATLDELKPIIRFGQPLATGKIPNDLLEKYLDEFTFEDPSVLINPGIGEDTAAVDMTGEEVLVLKSDPITFATDSIGRYAVLVNANDIATSGADPRWMLTTFLFPCGITASGVFQTMGELKAVCKEKGITLCGGHTEITDAVTRPVITGMMIGTVARKNLIEKKNMEPGDEIIITKGIAVEGTAIIAREFHEKLRKSGLTETEIQKSRRFLDHISIIKEARIARDIQGVNAMHDVTEGGLATAVNELGIAGGCRIHIDMDRIPILPETKKISRLLDIDPLGLIGSGSLLICCGKAFCQQLTEKIQTAGIQATRIGTVLTPGRGVESNIDDQYVPWPHFEVDEITRLFKRE